MDQYQDFVRIVDIKTFCPQFGSRSPIKVHLNSGLENTYCYEFHYHALHKHVCSVCRKSFPNGKLLELHCFENHDFLNSSRSGGTTFACLVAECDTRYVSAAERKKHLVEAHGFPPSFRFEPSHVPLSDAPSACTDAMRPSQQKVMSRGHQSLPRYVRFGADCPRAFPPRNPFARVANTAAAECANQPEMELELKELTDALPSKD